MFYYEQITMAKSITKNKLTEFNLEKIKSFTETELEKLIDQELPMCYQIGTNTVIVGRYKTIKINDSCWRVYENKSVIFDFFIRKDAIFYCIALHTRENALADIIKINDALLGKLETDAQLCRYRYKIAIESQDMWNIDLYSNKYSEIVLKIGRIKKELKKSINLTKYNKP